MINNGSNGSIIFAALIGLLAMLGAPGRADAQVRGLYTPGVYSTNSGVQPEPGLTYSNLFLDYTFNELHGPDGERLQANPSFTVLIDFNVFEFVSKKKILGANIGAVALIGVANASLSFAALGNVAGGAGFSDSFYEPINLGWHLKRADIQAGYAFIAPTGRFVPGSTTNIGSGYWAHSPFAGETVYLTKNKALAASAFQFYEFHGTQTGTEVHPGQTMSLDYSVTQVLPLQKTTLLQFGLIGYGQWQTTNKTG
ncbi:MAG TPA: transporter, partial [Blastocatellia bacterium]|nr:transporter [Blastocatellia bacterium]